MPTADAGTDAITALYRRVGPLCYRLARAILGGGPAEDVVQEAFLQLWRRRELLSEAELLDGYAVRATRNLAYKRLRRLRVEQVARTELERGATLVVGAADGRPDPALDEALRALPPEQREVVHLRVYEGLPMTTIAARTGVPLGTVHSRYRYALEKLRQRLGGGEA